MSESAHSTETILESISDGVFTVDRAWRVTSFNRAAEVITGIARDQAIGQRCCDVFRSSLCEIACPLRRTLESGDAAIDLPCWFVDAEGRRIPISVSTAVLRDRDGTVIGGAETFRDLSEIEQLRHLLAGRFTIGDLVSRAAAMRPVLQLVPAVAAAPSTVLITGETGTGKELLARAIHGAGPRADGPFVAVNCGAFPDQLLESELFGHVRGAFTGAEHDRQGRFAQADGGTLFLDEIGEVSPALQVRLLRVLQERRVQPLGADRDRQVEVRILAATNRDLAAEVAAHRFREDLYYRINVVRIDLPPLRDRREDIPLLVEHFIHRFNVQQGRHLTRVSSRALQLLLAHPWPGNVRELENAIERAFVLCPDDEIQAQHLPPEIVGPATATGNSSLRDTRALLETEAIHTALDRHHGNRTAAAQALGIHKSTLLRRMHRLGIVGPKQDGRQR
jgi:PAS domain S-box-containing protein